MGDSEKSETQDAERPDSVTHKSQPTTTVPLVSLVPAHHRHAVQRASLKAVRGSEGPKTPARHAGSSIRVRHSAPGQNLRASPNDLRVSKSAPDLRAPVLAAIKGLQDGSLQVDLRTRSKIANAARKVLEAREQRRRAKQDVLQGASQEAKRAILPHIPPVSESRQKVALPGKETDRIVSDQDTAGKEYELPGAQVHEASTAPIASFPFIVTTGMPKYAQGQVAGRNPPISRSLSGVQSRMSHSSSSALKRAEEEALGSDLHPEQDDFRGKADS